MENARTADVCADGGGEKKIGYAANLIPTKSFTHQIFRRPRRMVETQSRASRPPTLMLSAI
jgi:hypothetical protein